MITVRFKGGPLDGQERLIPGRQPRYRDKDGNRVPIKDGDHEYLHPLAGGTAQLYVRQTTNGIYAWRGRA